MVSKRKPAGRKPVIPKLTKSECFALAREYEEAHKAEGTAKKRKTEISRSLVYNIFERMKVKSLTARDSSTRITVVQNEHVEYDQPGLWRALKPSQRRLAFDTNVNLNALSPETRKALIAAVPRDELKAVTTHSLNVDNLSMAVQKGKIEGSIVAEHSEVVKDSPYVRISHGGE